MSRSAVGWVRGAAGAGLFLLLAVRLSADPHIRTGGIPSDITQSVTQRFHKGDHITGEGLAATVVGANISPIIISCQGGDVLESTDIRVIIPGTLPLTWKADIFPTVSAVVVGSPANPVNPGPPPAGIASPAGVGLATTFPDPGGAEKTIFLDVTGSFVPGNAFTLGNLKVLNVDTTAAATHIQMKTSVGQAIPYDDVAWWMVAEDPSNVVFAGGQQILTPGTATQALGALTITESNTAPAALTPFNGSIWNDKDIRITIPSSVTGVTWNTGAISSLNAKIGASVTTEDAGRTVVIPVVDGSSNDFTQGEAATISGLTMNVTAAAPDQTFSLIVRLGGATHYTAHFTMTNVCKVEGWPKLATQGGPSPSVFTMGAAATPTGTFTITESSGAGVASRKMVNGVNLDVTIPNSLNLQWSVVPAAAIGAGAGTASVGVITIQPGGKILRIPVTGDFSASQVLTLTGAQFANFTGQNLTDQFLQLELDAPHAGPEAIDSRAIRIGRPSISSTNDDVFLIGGGGGTLNTITVTDDPVNAVLANNTQVRIHISSGSNLSFTGALPTLGGGFTGGAVSFEDANKTMVVTWKSAPVANATGTISNAAVSWPAAASFGNLELWMATVGSTLVANASSQNLIVGNLPSMASTLTQQFTVNDPDPTAHPITITSDPGSFQLFQAGNSLQLIIPSALNLQWKNPQPGGFTMSGSAFTNGRMTGAINYPDTKTLEFPINLDWASGETLTFTGLQFATVGAVSPPTGLQLRVRVGGPIAATDTNAKAIGAPVLASNANQVFGDTDPATTMSPITITEHGVTPRILANSTLRIRIPGGFNMTWDPASTPVLNLGAGSGTLGVAPFFSDADSVLNIPIGATGFSANQTLGITGARFLISGTSALSHLELEVNSSGVANVLDTRSILIGIRPTINAVSTDDSNGNGSIDRIKVTFSEPMEASGSQSISSGLGFAFGTYNISTGSLDGTKTILTLIIAETGLPDTNAVPALTYTATGPGAGDLKDFNDGLGVTAAIPATVDGARPVVLGITVVDLNGDGRPDQAFVTFSETILGTPLLSHWTMIDANGATDLLAGLTDSSLKITGATNNVIQFDLTGASGTLGTPRFQYRNIAPPLADAAGNVVATQTNNGSPVANAGQNQVVAPSLVTLDGTASTDPDGQPLLYDWSYLGGPVLLPQLMLTGTTTSKPTFLATAAGTYTFQLKVSDFLVSQTALTTVTVLNAAPTAYAGPDLTVLNTGGGNLPLNALASSDANGDTLTYQWKVLSGPAFVNQTSPLPVLTGFFDVDGLFQLELQVTDGSGAMSTDTMWVRVNSVGSNCPTADAGPDQIVPINTLVTLDGRNTSDTDGGPLTFTWSGPLTLDTSVQDQPTFTPTAPGVYTFTLSVTDFEGHGSIPSTVRVLAYNPANLPPLAVANKLTLGTPTVGQTVTLDSAGSLDPEGKPLKYIWTQLRGASVALSDSSGATPTFAATQPGTYEFQLVVSDSVQYSLPSIVSFPVTTSGGAVPVTTTSLTAPPTVFGTGHVVNNPTAMQLTSTAVGTTHVVWTQEAGPSVPFDAIPASTSFTPGVGKRGVYRFNRTGWNAEGVVATSQLVLVVDDPGDVAPTAKAGADQTVTAGQLVTLDGGLSTDNSPTPSLIPFWVQIVGPPVALGSSNTLTPSFTPTTPGVYLFALTVSDGVANSLSDFVQITVNPAPVKKPSGSGGGGGCGSVGVDVLILVGLASVGWRRRRL